MPVAEMHVRCDDHAPAQGLSLVGPRVRVVRAGGGVVRPGGGACKVRPAAAGLRLGPRRSFGGFSLVEVLITVIVLAAGLLGMARLQISVLRTNDSSRFRTIATQASADLVDRLRADPAAVLGARGRTASLAAGACAIARTVLWEREFCAFGLPRPSGSASAVDINCPSQTTNAECGNGNCRIIVRWNDGRGDVGGADRNVEFRTCTRVPDL